ncbi:MAG: hypothetical protein AAGJ79_02020 [Verrucomicrobiota bacterium]
MAAEPIATESKPETKRLPWWASTMFMAAVFFIALVVFPELRETVFSMVAGTFQIVFTPVILEATLAVGGFLVVLIAVSLLRKKEDKDEWVYLSQVDPESVAHDEEIPAPLQKRIDGVPFTEEKSADHELPDVSVETVEGYIRLKMFDEAIADLMQLTEVGESKETRRLRWMLERESKGEDAAAALLGKWRSEGVISDSEVDTWSKGL